MTLMQRRRALMGAKKTPGEQWDYVWNYTDGMLEDNGFTKTLSGNAGATLASDGVILASGGGNIIYNFPIEQVQNGAVEIEAKIDALPGNSNRQGFRLCLSNGQRGGQIAVPDQGICLMTSNAGAGMEKISDITTGVWYIIRIVLKGPAFDVYLNGSKIVSDRTNLNLYASQTRIIQNAGGRTTIRRIKYKVEQEVTP